MSDFDCSKLNAAVPPKPREVWKLDDEQVRLHEKGKEGKSRYVLVVSKDCDKLDGQIINVVPLTTKREYDRLTFPMSQGYEKIYNGFTPDQSSTAVIQFYQPIRRDYFKDICGRIDCQTYCTIKQILCNDVVGFADEFDMSLD